ncbi:hypothetical protein EAY64_05570 [Aquitalea palustris]|uniref:Ubiquitin-activating enzyme E1 FCCH domain-containing protein n=1 Tax=Aquitalea palustris TaxID=2480983 RepID=A0A454JL09_9NEIS|nr:hypothetical protein [Aquitalea palustris]RMD00066.1 hypothetical protein EAY64_05570 [Aquitalea palustris]
MGTKAFDRSFAAGEITPEMYGRLDLTKEQTGLATCRNAIVLPHGPVANRPGTEFVSEIKSSANPARLIPFTYSITQTMAIEVGAGYFRFHSQAGTLMNGGVPYEVANSYAQADIANIHYVQSADVLTLVHPNYPIAELRRLGATNWTLTNPSFAIPTYCPTGATATVTSPHTSSWNPVNYQYCVTTVQTGDLQESIASNVTTAISNDLTLLGNYNTITWTLPTGVTPIRFNVYKLVNGLWGYIGQAAATATSFIDNNITPNASQTPPIMDSGFNDAVGNYPAAVSYYQQRRCFGGTNNAPQNVWMTMSGTESNLTYTLPVTASNRVAFRIAAREASAIRHLVPVANLIMLTASCEWRVSSTDGSALWASNLSVQPQSYIGANNVTPIVVGNTVLFSQARGGRIREMAYNWQAQAYLTNDISVLAPHLFDYNQVLDMCFSRAPYPILWAVSTNGNLLGMTYVPEQQVAAWHRHDFGGNVEAVCCITEQPAGTLASEDMLYLIVNRVINGVTRRFIERMHTRYFNTPSDAFFVDSGATNFLPGTFSWSGTAISCNIPSHGLSTGNSAYFTFSNTALSGTYTVTSVTDTNNLVLTSTTVGQGSGTVSQTPAQYVSQVSGLTWLAGLTVNVLVDGAPIPARQVSSGGVVTLDYPGTKVVVGLPITTQVQTLPISLQVDTAMGQTLEKNVTQAWLRLYRTSGVYVGPDFNTLTLATQRSFQDLPGNQPALFSGVLPVVITPAWQFDGAICIQQTDPLPMTLTSVALDISVS